MVKFIRTDKKKHSIILEFANNHMGDLSLFKKMVDDYCSVKDDFPDFDFSIKLQYRDLDSFIHAKYKKNSDHSGVQRFESTRVSIEEWSHRIDYAISKGFRVGCTPFDEVSVANVIHDPRFSFLKIGSCSFDDWPMLESIKSLQEGRGQDLNIIASTGGMDLNKVDRVTSFLSKIENVNLSLMHCIAEYPCQVENLNLNWIRLLKDRYRLDVGFSTHEDGDEILTGGLALCAGAQIFEKHVVSEDATTINAYSSKPSQIREWLINLRKADILYGQRAARVKRFEFENKYLDNFRRGAYVSKSIKKGEQIPIEDLYMAFPKEENCLSANDISKYGVFSAQKNLLENDPMNQCSIEVKSKRGQIEKIKESVLKAINEANIFFDSATILEISHHYGLKKFDEFGMSMITVINLDYCKKYMFLRAGQQHPEQYHKIKRETFILLRGEVDLFLDGKLIKLMAGVPVTIDPHVTHSMLCNSDAIIEEISTSHIADDSYYVDSNINLNQDRKSFISLYHD